VVAGVVGGGVGAVGGVVGGGGFCAEPPDGGAEGPSEDPPPPPHATTSRAIAHSAEFRRHRDVRIRSFRQTPDSLTWMLDLFVGEA